MTRLEVVPLPCDREVAEGDDLAALVLAACRDAGVTLADGDVLCVAQKVVSKAEGAMVDIASGGDPHETRRRVAREQAVRVVADAPWVLVVETQHGLVCANAGVDASNVADGRLALLPDDPDASAEHLRGALREAAGVDVGVLVTDTFGRPWRLGQTDVAIGAAGVAVLRDERGGRDRLGHELEVTEPAVADELAGMADVVRRKADGTPFVLVRGADVSGDGRARDLVRPSDDDLFRVGGPRAVLAGLADGDVGQPAPIEVLEQVGAHASAHLPAAGAAIRLRPTDSGLALDVTEDADDLAAGVLLAAARIAAHTAGWHTRWAPAGAAADEPTAGAPWRRLGHLDVGRPPR